MKKSFVRITMAILVLTISVMLAACGSDSTSTPAPLGTILGSSGNAVNMSGTWTGCSYNANDQQDEKISVSINGSAFTYVVAFLDATGGTANCTQSSAPVFTITATGNAAAGTTGTPIWKDGGASASAPTGLTSAQATAVNLTFATGTVVPSASAATYFNSNNVCGGGWTANVAKNVLGCTYFFDSATQTDYWVIDDSSTPLKWYSSDSNTAWEVDINGPLQK